MYKIFASIVVFILLAVGLAMAAGKLPYDRNRQQIQNINAISPEKSASGCVTKTGTKGVFGTYTGLSGYVAYEGEVVTAAGAAEPVTWELDGTPVAAGPSFKMVNNGGNTYNRIVQRIYSSGTSRTLKSCNRRQ